VRVCAAVLVIAVSAMACTSGGAAQVHEGDVRAIVFNYCGNVCAHGDDRGARFVQRLVDEVHASVVLLQEVCRSQADRLRADLATIWHDAELAFVTTFAEDLDGRNECADDDYGMAIIAPGVRRHWTVSLPNPGLGGPQIDARSILCAIVTDDPAFTACTTHLVRAANDAEAHRAQVHAFVDAATELSTTSSRVVIAGDLNDTIDVFARLAAEDGPYRSASSPSGIDHAFVTRGAFSGAEVRAHACACSDHDAIVVTASVDP
jgi:endonuclease/exonuclease/phosphatase family metal-dependent hydrolase